MWLALSIGSYRLCLYRLCIYCWHLWWFSLFIYMVLPVTHFPNGCFQTTGLWHLFIEFCIKVLVSEWWCWWRIKKDNCHFSKVNGRTIFTRGMKLCFHIMDSIQEKLLLQLQHWSEERGLWHWGLWHFLYWNKSQLDMSCHKALRWPDNLLFPF